MDFNNFNLEEINQVLDEKHRDPNRKEIGDRVSIIDFSSCTYLNGAELDYDLEDDVMVFNFNTELIVIETGQKHIYDVQYTKYTQNLVIVNTLTNMKFRISSGHVTFK
jgi:hypothetical protein